jgi:vesicle coat complex subunit
MSVERDPKRKRDIIKKVIAYMTLGIDVSRLFTDMIMVRQSHTHTRAYTYTHIYIYKSVA